VAAASAGWTDGGGEARASAVLWTALSFAAGVDLWRRMCALCAQLHADDCARTALDDHASADASSGGAAERCTAVGRLFAAVAALGRASIADDALRSATKATVLAFIASEHPGAPRTRATTGETPVRRREEDERRDGGVEMQLVALAPAAGRIAWLAMLRRTASLLEALGATWPASLCWLAADAPRQAVQAHLRAPGGPKARDAERLWAARERAGEAMSCWPAARR
jgi:hypothetical protein